MKSSPFWQKTKQNNLNRKINEKQLMKTLVDFTQLSYHLFYAKTHPVFYEGDNITSIKSNSLITLNPRVCFIALIRTLKVIKTVRFWLKIRDYSSYINCLSSSYQLLSFPWRSLTFILIFSAAFPSKGIVFLISLLYLFYFFFCNFFVLFISMAISIL